MMMVKSETILSPINLSSRKEIPPFLICQARSCQNGDLWRIIIILFWSFVVRMADFDDFVVEIQFNCDGGG